MRNALASWERRHIAKEASGVQDTLDKYVQFDKTDKFKHHYYNPYLWILRYANRQFGAEGFAVADVSDDSWFEKVTVAFAKGCAEWSHAVINKNNPDNPQLNGLAKAGMAIATASGVNPAEKDVYPVSSLGPFDCVHGATAAEVFGQIETFQQMMFGQLRWLGMALFMPYEYAKEAKLTSLQPASPVNWEALVEQGVEVVDEKGEAVTDSNGAVIRRRYDLLTDLFYQPYAEEIRSKECREKDQKCWAPEWRSMTDALAQYNLLLPGSSASNLDEKDRPEICDRLASTSEGGELYTHCLEHAASLPSIKKRDGSEFASNEEACQSLVAELRQGCTQWASQVPGYSDVQFCESLPAKLLEAAKKWDVDPAVKYLDFLPKPETAEDACVQRTIDVWGDKARAVDPVNPEPARQYEKRLLYCKTYKLGNACEQAAADTMLVETNDIFCNVFCHKVNKRSKNRLLQEKYNMCFKNCMGSVPYMMEFDEQRKKEVENSVYMAREKFCKEHANGKAYCDPKDPTFPKTRGEGNRRFCWNYAKHASSSLKNFFRKCGDAARLFISCLQALGEGVSYYTTPFQDTFIESKKCKAAVRSAAADAIKAAEKLAKKKKKQ